SGAALPPITREPATRVGPSPGRVKWLVILSSPWPDIGRPITDSLYLADQSGNTLGNSVLISAGQARQAIDAPITGGELVTLTAENSDEDCLQLTAVSTCLPSFGGGRFLLGSW